MSKTKASPHHHHHHDNHEHHHFPHEHGHDHGVGHNHGPESGHMHSHVHSDPKAERLERLKALSASFIESFRGATDKPAFLELAGVPATRTGIDGLKLHLIDTEIVSKWQLGTASPAFGSRELVHLPYPASMVEERETMTFTYVSLTERADIDLVDILVDIHENKGTRL